MTLALIVASVSARVETNCCFAFKMGIWLVMSWKNQSGFGIHDAMRKMRKPEWLWHPRRNEGIRWQSPSKACRVTSTKNLFMVQYATFQDFLLWIYQNWFYSRFSTELSFNLFIKRKDVLESQMIRESETLKITTIGRVYLPGLLRFTTY